MTAEIGPFTCDHHPDADAAGEPVGERCAREATHVVTWPRTRQVSYGCDEHVAPESFDTDAPHIVTRLPDGYRGGPIDVRNVVRFVGVDPLDW